jgi:TolB-like protein
MQAVWGDVFVTDDSITQCVTEIRRALGEKGARLLQTLPKRGYLLATEVTRAEACSIVGAVETSAPPTPQTADENEAAELRPELPSKPVRYVVLATSLALLLSAAAAGWVYRDHLFGRLMSSPTTAQSTPLQEVGFANAPRLSVVVLPFTNLGGLDDETVDGLTEDLTTTIGGTTGFLVIARSSAATYKGKSIDIRQVGQELGVRYAVEGSARRNGDAMRVTVQAVSTETGAHILVNQFDIGREGVGYNVDDVVRQIGGALVGRLLNVESERSLRERPENPDVDDLVLRARAMRWRGFSPQTQGQVVALFERAVALDPSSVRALAGLADAILDSIAVWTDDPTAPTKLRRAEDLITRAEQLRPDDTWVLWDRVFLLAKAGRYDEAIPAAQKAIEINPNTSGPYFWLGNCLMFNGRPAEAIAEYKQGFCQRSRQPAWSA